MEEASATKAAKPNMAPASDNTTIPVAMETDDSDKRTHVSLDEKCEQNMKRFKANLGHLEEKVKETIIACDELEAIIRRVEEAPAVTDPTDTTALALRIETVAQLQILRQLNRDLYTSPKDLGLMTNHGSLSFAFKEAANSKGLTLYDRQYLVHYLKACIDSEVAQGTGEHKLLALIDKDQFLEEAPENMKTNEKISDEKNLFISRMDYERAQRKALMDKAEELAQRKKVIVGVTNHKKGVIASINPKLHKLLAVCKEVQQRANPSINNDLACLLPEPLYNIYLNVTACIRAYEMPVSASIQGKVVEVKMFNSVLEKDIKTKPATKAIMSKVFPLSLDLSFRGPGHPDVVVTIRYLPHLHLITVTVKDTLREARLLPTNLVSSVWAANALLDEIFPDDRGRRLPFNASPVQAALHMAGVTMEEVVKAIPLGGRFYRWAQWLAGSDFVAKQTGHAVTMTKHDQCFHVHQVLDLIGKRVETLSALYKQLSSLAINQVDLGSLPQSRISEMFPQKPQSQLIKFISNGEKYDLLYTLLFSSDDYEVDVRVRVSTEYPIRVPDFSLSLRKGVVEGDLHCAMRNMEMELNSAGHRLAWDVQSRNFILSLQLRRLQEIFDAYVRIMKATVDENSMGKLFERRT
eukprot:Ihof_evm2s24 gene=Ihof_evmTU2s24